MEDKKIEFPILTSDCQEPKSLLGRYAQKINKEYILKLTYYKLQLLFLWLLVGFLLISFVVQRHVPQDLCLRLIEKLLIAIPSLVYVFVTFYRI